MEKYREVWPIGKWADLPPDWKEWFPKTAPDPNTLAGLLYQTARVSYRNGVFYRNFYAKASPLHCPEKIMSIPLSKTDAIVVLRDWSFAAVFCGALTLTRSHQ